MSCTAGTLGTGWQLVSLMETLSPAQGQMFVDSCLHTHPFRFCTWSRVPFIHQSPSECHHCHRSLSSPIPVLPHVVLS